MHQNDRHEPDVGIDGEVDTGALIHRRPMSRLLLGTFSSTFLHIGSVPFALAHGEIWKCCAQSSDFNSICARLVTRIYYGKFRVDFSA